MFLGIPWVFGMALVLPVLLRFAIMGARLRSRKRQFDESNVALADAQTEIEKSNVSFPDMILVGSGP